MCCKQCGAYVLAGQIHYTQENEIIPGSFKKGVDIYRIIKMNVRRMRLFEEVKYLSVKNLIKSENE